MAKIEVAKLEEEEKRFKKSIVAKRKDMEEWADGD